MPVYFGHKPALGGGGKDGQVISLRFDLGFAFFVLSRFWRVLEYVNWLVFSHRDSDN